MRIATQSPQQVVADVASQEPDNAVALPLLDVDTLMRHQVLGLLCARPHNDGATEGDAVSTAGNGPAHPQPNSVGLAFDRHDGTLGGESNVMSPAGALRPVRCQACHMAFVLPDLPYAPDALDPHISERTFSFHHGKHHATYIANLNRLVDGTPHADSTLEAIVGDAPSGPLFNNAAQAWNHAFYWQSLTPSSTAPDAALAAAIDAAFGSLDTALTELADAATTHFGSGWAWLVRHADGTVAVMTTHDADLPMKHDATALLTIDVWEHAYYLDHQNARAAYVKAVCSELLNWDFASANFQR
jgi:superoxide dismutase, Fe-Mn family